MKNSTSHLSAICQAAQQRMMLSRPHAAKFKQRSWKVCGPVGPFSFQHWSGALIPRLHVPSNSCTLRCTRTPGRSGPARAVAMPVPTANFNFLHFFCKRFNPMSSTLYTEFGWQHSKGGCYPNAAVYQHYGKLGCRQRCPQPPATP